VQSDDTATISSNAKLIVGPKQHRPATYRTVLDKRKRPIGGLLERNGRYYAQMTVEVQGDAKGCGCVPAPASNRAVFWGETKQITRDTLDFQDAVV